MGHFSHLYNALSVAKSGNHIRVLQVVSVEARVILVLLFRLCEFLSYM